MVFGLDDPLNSIGIDREHSRPGQMIVIAGQRSAVGARGGHCDEIAGGGVTKTSGASPADDDDDGAGGAEPADLMSLDGGDADAENGAPGPAGAAARDETTPPVMKI